VAASDDESSSDETGEGQGPGRSLGLVGLLFELLLPAALSAAILLTLARYTAYWDLRTPIGLGVFAVLLVVLSFFVSVRVDAMTLAGRVRRGRRQLLNRAGARSRLVKFVLGGVVVPVAVFVAATRVELPNRQTPMSLALQFRLTSSGSARAEALGNAVLHAGTPLAREQGILALQTLGSPDGLDQLLRILDDDPRALEDVGGALALGKALAAYGAPARTKLRQRFEQVGPDVRRTASGPPGDLFARYFAPGFAALTSEVERASADPALAERRERVRAAQAELQQALGRLESEAPTARGGSRLPVFVLQTFRSMAATEDADLLRFARATAADPGWSDPVRGEALLLVAKLGGKDDLDGLFASLENASPVLQARALEAIASLQAKLAAAGPPG
jgi:hypothetical protein